MNQPPLCDYYYGSEADDNVSNPHRPKAHITESNYNALIIATLLTPER